MAQKRSNKILRNKREKAHDFLYFLSDFSLKNLIINICIVPKESGRSLRDGVQNNEQKKRMSFWAWRIKAKRRDGDYQRA